MPTKDIVEYRFDQNSLTWTRSWVGWDYKDVDFFNRICGWVKYRIRTISWTNSEEA